MTLYTVVHLFDGTLIDGGVTLHPFTSRNEALDDMYQQLDRTYGQLDPDEFQSFYSETFGCAYISHYEATEPHEPAKTVHDHEWRIVSM